MFKFFPIHVMKDIILAFGLVLFPIHSMKDMILDFGLVLMYSKHWAWYPSKVLWPHMFFCFFILNFLNNFGLFFIGIIFIARDYNNVGFVFFSYSCCSLHHKTCVFNLRLVSNICSKIWTLVGRIIFFPLNHQN